MDGIHWGTAQINEYGLKLPCVCFYSVIRLKIYDILLLIKKRRKKKQNE